MGVCVQMPRRGQTPFSFCILNICYSKLRACRKYQLGQALLPCLGLPTLPWASPPICPSKGVHKSSFRSPRGLARPPRTSVTSQWKQLKTTWQNYGVISCFIGRIHFSLPILIQALRGKPASLQAPSGWYPRLPDSFLFCLRSPRRGEARLPGWLWPPCRPWRSSSGLTGLARRAA